MIKVDSTDRLRGLDVVDANGERIGKVREVWTDEQTGQPVWASVDTGTLGIHHSFFPLRDARVTPEHVSVTLSRRVVEDSPRVSPTGDTMADVEQRALHAYYQIPEPEPGR